MDMYWPAFPDGSPVPLGQLSDWLDGIRNDPHFSEEAQQVAEAIVTVIRRRLN